MAAAPLILPILSGVGAALGIGTTVAGLIGGSGEQVPQFLPEEQPSAFDDEVAGQSSRVDELRRQAISRSRTLTNIQDNPIDEGSLLTMLSRR